MIGSPGNMIANSNLQEAIVDVSFFAYGEVGLPMLIVNLYSMHSLVKDSYLRFQHVNLITKLSKKC